MTRAILGAFFQSLYFQTKTNEYFQYFMAQK